MPLTTIGGNSLRNIDGMAALQRSMTHRPSMAAAAVLAQRPANGRPATIECDDLSGGRKRSTGPGRQTAVARVTCLRADDRRAKNGVQYGATETSWCRM
jgi:hypothetical protein